MNDGIDLHDLPGAHGGRERARSIVDFLRKNVAVALPLELAWIRSRQTHEE